MDSSCAPSPSSSSTSVLSSLTNSSPSLARPSPSPPCTTLYYEEDDYDARGPIASKPFPSLLVNKRKLTRLWFSRLFRPTDEKLTMEAHDGPLLSRPSQGDADVQKCLAKPKCELRFAAKIAAAMDADGLMGVKDSVCAAEVPSAMQTAVSEKNVGTFHHGTNHQYIPWRAPVKQTHPRRRWRICRRLRRSRVVVACMLQKIRKVFSTSTKRNLQVRDGFLK